MLMHYIPEVKGVEQVADPEDEVASKEFEKIWTWTTQVGKVKELE